MNYTIKNEALTITISDKGAELQSIKSADGTEYLWQADPTYWSGKAPNIFPYVARLTEGKYVLEGKEYEMKIHGIVRYQTLVPEKETESSITFRLDANEETKAQYPYEFTYRITFSVEGNKLITTSTVENRDTRRMFFGIGGHPGFNVPMEEGLAFEDYYLEFEEEAHPNRVEFNEICAVIGETQNYPLLDGKKIPLGHRLFDNDAIVLRNACRTVTIASDKGSRSVKVSYPDFQYIGFWHKPLKDAPYVCIEPWSSLPSRSNIIENFAQQSDLMHVDAGDAWKTVWTIEIR